MSVDGQREARSYRPEGIDDAFTGDSQRPVLPTLGARGWLRWTWRQLTSMRVALLLLMLLAVAAVPGSTFPQLDQDPAAVAQYLDENPTWGPWLDRLGFFTVYSSVWFSAIYLLLFVSLIGCIVPRLQAHLGALRARPPRTPRRFARFPAQANRAYAADVTPAQVVDDVAAHLRRRTLGLPAFRVVRDVEDGGRETVAGERGYLRETGNIVFHLSLVGLLVAVGVGQALEYRGQAIVTQGRGFANSVSGYDTFSSGTLFEADSLHPFTMVLDRFEAQFSLDEQARAQDFTAFVTVTEPGVAARAETIKVNHPLQVGGAKVYLQGNGYAPQVTVRDAAGEVAFAGTVPFIPEDGVYTSRGVIKVPDVSTGEQIGLVGYLLPTAQAAGDGVRSIHPEPYNPLLVLTVWSGDLGLDEGVPQNVYELDTSGMTQSVDDAGPVTLLIAPGETVELPDGLGTIELADLPRFVALDLRHDPALAWILVFSLTALGGLALSLFTPRRRVWARAWIEDGPAGRRTVVEVAGLARHDDVGLQAEVDAALDAVRGPALTADADADGIDADDADGMDADHTTAHDDVDGAPHAGRSEEGQVDGTR